MRNTQYLSVIQLIGIFFTITIIGFGQSFIPSTTLQDSFQGYSPNPITWMSRWEKGSLSNCSSNQSVAVNYSNPIDESSANRTLDINPIANTNGTNFNGFVSKYLMNFTNSFVSSEIFPKTNNFVTELSMGQNCNNWYRIYRKGNNIQFQTKTGGGTVGVLSSISYDPNLHRYWRIRHIPTTNKIVFETSAINRNVVGGNEKEHYLNWIQRAESNVNFPINQVRFEIVGGTDSSVPVTETIQIDNFLFDSNDGGVIPPQQQVDTTYPTNLGGNTINVTSCNQLQPALNSAQPGDTINITYTLSCNGSFTFPVKTNPNNKYIIVRSSSAEFDNAGSLRVGRRINGENPAHSQQMPKLYTSDYQSVINFPAGANYYRIVGIEVSTNPNCTSSCADLYGGLIQLEASSNQVHHVIFDRTYIHGFTNSYSANIKRAIGLNGSHLAVIDSYISRINLRPNVFQNQAIGIWSGTGPIKIENNYLEALAQNILIGGDGTATSNQSVADVTIRRNLFEKRNDIYQAFGCSLPINSQNCPGFPPTNGIELKQGLRIQIEDNIFNQTKEGLFIRPGADSGCPMCLTEHISVKNNKFFNVNKPFYGVTETTQIVNNYTPWFLSHVTVENNLVYFTNLTSDIIGFNNSWGLSGRGDISNFRLIHNTVESEFQWLGTALGEVKFPNMEMRDNIIEKRSYGFPGESNNSTIKIRYLYDNYFPYSFRRNIIANNSELGSPYSVVDDSYFVPNYPCTIIGGAYCSEYGFYVVPSWDQVLFAEGSHPGSSSGNYRLATNSPFKNQATDGTDIGVNQDILESALCGTLIGNWESCGGLSTPYPGPNPPNIPGIIEAENYDNGGQGVAYNDFNAGNIGGVYRSNDVDIYPRTTANNGFVVNDARAGEWLKYTINVPTAGIYDINVRYASQFNNGIFHIEIDGTDVTGPMIANSTGHWATFQNLTKSGVSISAGQHVVRLVMDTNSPDGCNCIVADFDSISFTNSSINWQNIDSTSSSGGNVQYIGPSYCGMARSQQTLSGSGYFEWTFTGGLGKVGLGNNNDEANDCTPSDLDFSINIGSTSGFAIRRFNNYLGDGALTVGDILRIEILPNGNVAFKKNGVDIIPPLVNPPKTYPYYLVFKGEANIGPNNISNAKIGF